MARWTEHKAARKTRSADDMLQRSLRVRLARVGVTEVLEGESLELAISAITIIEGISRLVDGMAVSPAIASDNEMAEDLLVLARIGQPASGNGYGQKLLAYARQLAAKYA